MTKSLMIKTSRRRFIQTTAGITATFFASPIILSEEAKGANERIGVGAIGAGSMGSGDTKHASWFGNIVAVADADLKHAERLKKTYNDKPVVYQDYRKLLENKDVDVVIQATPDHWHTKINIDAMRAGKEVYGEKPFSLTIDEGKLVCKTVKETGRIFQTGTQQRSGKE
ncbi:MAG: Gfo/Idh/MocA family oxidoreductase, partial [Planctomycetaceae bacterium]|nr:Gfo/Idh/MocA family oxidoreductase [Planctomycetaceae bacterium]